MSNIVTREQVDKLLVLGREMAWREWDSMPLANVLPLIVTINEAVELLRKASEFLYVNTGYAESENTEIEIDDWLSSFDGQAAKQGAAGT